jgi:sterol desaturase/sphingolipid hydroxylase (fatty acid hydroxylase superfamily)
MTGTAQYVLVLAGLGAALFSLERLVPLRPSRAPLLRRLLINVAISAVALGAASVAVQPAASAMLEWTSQGNIGLLQFVDGPPAMRIGAAFVLMDLSFYYWHRLNHRVPLLWRFHNVHHIDPDLELSTAFRFHYGEVAISAGLRVVQVLVIGPTLAAYVIYEFGLQANTLFHHSNVRLPIRVERVLNRLLVTHVMLGILQYQVQRENF